MQRRSLLLASALCAVALLYSASSHAQVAPSERSQRGLDAFLEREAEQQAKRNQRFTAAGRPEITGQVRAIVASAGITPPNRAGASDQQLQRLRSSFEIEVAQRLVQFGFNPGDIARDPAVVHAAARYTRGEHSIADLSRLADLVVVGTVTSVSDESLSDRYRSTVALSNMRILKGASSGTAVRVRQESGRTEEGRTLEVEGDLRQTGKTYALFLSANLYAALADGTPGTLGRGARQARNDHYLPFGAWYEVQAEGRLVAASPGMPAVETLDALIAAIQ